MIIIIYDHPLTRMPSPMPSPTHTHALSHPHACPHPCPQPPTHMPSPMPSATHTHTLTHAITHPHPCMVCRTREIKDALLVPAQRKVLMYGLTLLDIRTRFASFRRNKAAVARATGSQRLRSAYNSLHPAKNLLHFLEGVYTTTEPAVIQILPGTTSGCTHACE